jgi:hypothetical protein
MEFDIETQNRFSVVKKGKNTEPFTAHQVIFVLYIHKLFTTDDDSVDKAIYCRRKGWSPSAAFTTTPPAL